MDIGISKKDRATIAKGLSQLLADSYTLYLMTHNFHWNVTGPQFNNFALYGAIPLAFALRAPSNALPAAFLLFSFYVNAASFLGFAIMAEKRGLKTEAQGQKSLFYMAGLMEGAETIGFFALFCLWPTGFSALAWIFGALCLVTACARILLSRKLLR